MAERIVIVCDICGALDARTVTLKAGSRTAQKDLCAQHMADLFSGSRRPRRGRRPVAPASPASPTAKRSRAKRKTAGKRGTRRKATSVEAA